MMKPIMEELLGRPLAAEDGIAPSLIVETEAKLGEPIPRPLKEFYALAGNIPVFMDSFEIFMRPEELYCEDGLLTFLEENQDVCR